MLNFIAIVLIIFIGILLLVLKKRSFRKFINKGKLHSVKFKKNRKNNNKFLSNKKVFYTITKQKSTHYSIKILKEIKCLVFLRVLQKINYKH